MEPVLTPAQMRDADAACIAAGTAGFVLMDRAAHACSVTALRMLGGAYGKRVVVACGKGNNGGDGIACARHLSAAGVLATVFLIGEPEGDAAAHLGHARTIARTGRFRTRDWESTSFDSEVKRADLVIDALLGTGSSGEPRGAVADVITSINSAGKRVLSIDIPSGVSAADGSVPSIAVSATVTVAIQALKRGHVMLTGALHCGRVEVAEIGIHVPDPGVYVPRGHDVARALPLLALESHKYSVGALAVLAGSTGMTGAAVLTAQGAIRTGAGLVMLGVPESTIDVVEGAVIEAIKIPLPEMEGRLDPKAVDEMSDRLDRCRALAIGPGVGRGPQSVALVRRALDVTLPLVIDGDGLWALAEVLSDEPDVLSSRSHATVLTPHTGEFVFLGGESSSSDRISAAQDVASRLGAVLHLKGRRAVTASPDGRVWVNTTGNPGLATGGTGDVLTGVVGALLAQGADAAQATWAGAYLHGLAGDIAAGRLGSRALAARDVPEALPQALRHVSGRLTSSGVALRTVLEPT